MEIVEREPAGSDTALAAIQAAYRALTMFSEEHIHAAFVKGKGTDTTVEEERLYYQDVLQFTADCFQRELHHPAPVTLVDHKQGTPMRSVMLFTIEALAGMARGRVENPMFTPAKGKKPKVSDFELKMRALIVAAAYSLAEGSFGDVWREELKGFGLSHTTVKRWKDDIDSRGGFHAYIADMRICRSAALARLDEMRIQNVGLLRSAHI